MIIYFLTYYLKNEVKHNFQLRSSFNFKADMHLVMIDGKSLLIFVKITQH